MSPSSETAPDSDADPRAGPRPHAGILLVQPQTTSYPRLVRLLLANPVRGVKSLFGKANSDMIAAADRGPFSHSALYRGTSLVDSRSQGPVAIAVSPVRAAEQTGRALSFYRFEPTDDDPATGDAAAAYEAVVELLGPLAQETGPELPDESNVFPVAAMVNLGLVLVCSQRRGLRWLGRLFTRYHEDAAGMYCAELVAKAMIAAKALFVVEVDASRLPPEGTVDERAVIAALRQRLEVWNSFPVGGQATDTSTASYPIERLRSLREGLLHESGPVATTRVTRRVGFGDEEFPPSLVSPNDLARSPSFVWAVNYVEDGSIEDREPELDRHANLARVLILGLVVLTTRSLAGWFERRGTTVPPPGTAP